MVRKLFGTDGIRGVAGRFPLDSGTIYATGVALGRWATNYQATPEIVLGVDTRQSSLPIAEQLSGGLVQAGASPQFAGVITTPGIAYLTQTNALVAGVMISASHNPFQDNGIKIFSHLGYKLPDFEEYALEQEIFRLLEQGVDPHSYTLNEIALLRERYLDYLENISPVALDGLTLVVDCAHGAGFKLAPSLLRKLGAVVYPLHTEPDGRNINCNCGSLHVERLRAEVIRCPADLGVALDGDGDRAIFVSRKGRVWNGDAVLWLAAGFYMPLLRLQQKAVVGTVMSNLGLEKALAGSGIRMIRTQVGDKYVLEEMLRCNCPLGGEPSGHIIFLDHATTGDGLLTALHVLAIMKAQGKDLDDLMSGLELYPQRLVNVRISKKQPIQHFLEEFPELEAEIRAVKEAFGESGRVVVRHSGTEPVIRVLVEGPDEGTVEKFARRIAHILRQRLG
jgi:phosphoglucosamine mutase